MAHTDKAEALPSANTRTLPLQEDMDASRWAREFMKLNEGNIVGRTVDEGLMISWFANAIMCGFDTANRRLGTSSETKEFDRNAVIDECLNAIGMFCDGHEGYYECPTYADAVDSIRALKNAAPQAGDGNVTPVFRQAEPAVAASLVDGDLATQRAIHDMNSPAQGETKDELVKRLRNCAALMGRDNAPGLVDAAREAADALENYVGICAAWKRDYDGQKARGDAWMADCKAVEARLVRSQCGELMVTRGDGVALPDQAAALQEFKTQARLGHLFKLLQAIVDSDNKQSRSANADMLAADIAKLARTPSSIEPSELPDTLPQLLRWCLTLAKGGAIQNRDILIKELEIALGDSSSAPSATGAPK